MTAHMPPLRLLQVFASVVRTRSTLQASTELNVSQPAVSQALKQLEAFVGTPLLNRKTRPIRTTEAGDVLEAATREGLGRIADALTHIKAMAQGDSFSATIACSVGVATYWLMPRLAKFYQAHPDIAVNVMTTPQGAPGFLPGVDLAVRYGRGDWDDGLVTKMLDERVIPVGSPSLIASLKGKSMAEVPLMHVTMEEDIWVTWPQYLKAYSLPKSRVRGRHFTNYVQVTQAAIDGQGIMLGWNTITGDLVKSGLLAPLTDQAVVPDDAYYITQRRPLRQPASLLGKWLTTEA